MRHGQHRAVAVHHNTTATTAAFPCNLRRCTAAQLLQQIEEHDVDAARNRGPKLQPLPEPLVHKQRHPRSRPEQQQKHRQHSAHNKLAAVCAPRKQVLVPAPLLQARAQHAQKNKRRNRSRSHKRRNRRTPSTGSHPRDGTEVQVSAHGPVRAAAEVVHQRPAVNGNIERHSRKRKPNGTNSALAQALAPLRHNPVRVHAGIHAHAQAAHKHNVHKHAQRRTAVRLVCQVLRHKRRHKQHHTRRNHKPKHNQQHPEPKQHLVPAKHLHSSHQRKHNNHENKRHVGHGWQRVSLVHSSQDTIEPSNLQRARSCRRKRALALNLRCCVCIATATAIAIAARARLS